MKTYQVYEHSNLRYEEGRDGYASWFKDVHLKAMADYHDHHGGNKYYSLIRSGVRFSQYVGVIQVLDITIEILPKTDRHEDQPAVWHNVLLKMLRSTRLLNLDYLSEASLKYRNHSILHLYFLEYVHQIQQLIQRGLIKKYRLNEGNLFSLKGALKFNKHITKNLVHKERFFTKHQIYDKEHLIHQILHKALLVVKKLTDGSSLSDDVNRALFQFPEMRNISISEKTFEQLQFDRKSSPYRKALQIAKMILLNYSPDIKGGSNELFALLFDMNDLWEEYVYRQLLKNGVDVGFQQYMKFWEGRKIKPDMVINMDGKTCIVDTKWKIVNDAQPADEDLRQIFTYNLYWKSNHGFLVYPKTSKSPETKAGKYHSFDETALDEMTCQVLYLDVLEDYQTVGNRSIAKLTEILKSTQK